MYECWITLLHGFYKYKIQYHICSLTNGSLIVLVFKMSLPA